MAAEKGSGNGGGKGGKNVQPIVSEEVKALSKQYMDRYGELPTLGVAKIQKLFDDSDTGINAVAIRLAEGKDDVPADGDGDTGGGDEDDDAGDDGDDGVRLSPEDRAKLSAQPGDPKAIGFATRLEEIPAVGIILHSLVEADTTKRRGPAELAYVFATNLSDEEIDAQPMPGSRYDDKNVGNNFDVRKPGKDGGGSHYGDVAGLLKEGREINSLLDSIWHATNQKGDPTKVLPQHKGKPKSWLDGEEETQTQRLTAFKNGVKEAMKFVKRRKLLRDKTHLKVSFRVETHDENGQKVKKLVRSNVPIRVYFEKKDEDTGNQQVIDRHVSIATFNKVDFDLVAKHTDAEVQLDNFKVTKGTGDDDTPADKTVSVATGDKAFEFIQELAGKLQNDKGVRAGILRIIASDMGGQLLDRMAALEEALHRHTSKPENKAKMLAFREQQDEAAA